MKKILMSLINLLLLTAIIFAVLGKLQFKPKAVDGQAATDMTLDFSLSGVPGYRNIADRSKILDETIEKVSILTSRDFPEKMSRLNSGSKQLITAREDYENKIAFSSQEDVQNSRKIQNYEMEFLWTTIGNYATKEGIGLDLKVEPGTITATKSLSFSVTGQYIAITDFIYAIEKDSDLNFVIENFLMSPNAENVLVATFMVKDLYINVATISSPEEQVVENNGTNSEKTDLDMNANAGTQNVKKLSDAITGTSNNINNQISNQTENE